MINRKFVGNIISLTIFLADKRGVDKFDNNFQRYDKRNILTFSSAGEMTHFLE